MGEDLPALRRSEVSGESGAGMRQHDSFSRDGAWRFVCLDRRVVQILFRPVMTLVMIP